VVPLTGIDAQHKAADAGVLVDAGGVVGPAAGAELKFAQLEVVLEFGPFLVGGLAVFSGGPQGPPLVDEGPVGADQVVLEHRQVGMGGGQVVMAEQPGGDVDGQAAGDRLGGEYAADVVRRIVQRLPGPVGEPGPLQGGADQILDGAGADDLPRD
jgi:hypothetical protein